jgi:hypothetical protein
MAQAAHLPTICGWREFVEAGSMMSHRSNIPEQFRRAADYVDKILHGAKPGDLPVEQPTKFDLIINLKTAKNLGIEMPATLLARADEVIERGRERAALSRARTHKTRGVGERPLWCGFCCKSRKLHQPAFLVKP